MGIGSDLARRPPRKLRGSLLDLYIEAFGRVPPSVGRSGGGLLTQLQDGAIQKLSVPTPNLLTGRRPNILAVPRFLELTEERP
jgi:hypothetical protein